MEKQVRLTKKRQLWVRNRSVILRGEPLRNCIVTEDRYAKKLEALTRRMTEDVSRQIKALFRSESSKDYFAMDASLGSQSRILINQLTHKYLKAFRHLAKPYATSMVTAVNKESQSNLFQSVEKMTGGVQLKTSFITNTMKDQIAAGIAENVGLIKSIPQEYLNYVGGAVMRSITQPNQGGLKELEKHIDDLLDKRNPQARNRARNIAYDQTRKMYNNLNASRMQAVGLNKYEWIHSGAGQQPREFHRDVLNGQIFKLDDPPIIDEATGERGIPSQLIHCRCTMRPLLEFEEGEEEEM